MRSIYIVIFFVGILWGIISCGLYTPLSKEKLTQNINHWYTSIGGKYTLEIKGSKANAKITRYHPERPEEKDDLIEITYKGMRMQLAFMKSIAEITTHKDSLQKYFNYISIDNIYNEIPTEGWEVYPRTPQSSLDREGVQFTGTGDALGLQVNWSTYTVMGYKKSKECQEELSMADNSISEGCYVSVRKTVPLEIVVSGLMLGY
jgi:hypothetical protein